ncbi:disulfide bond formation protein B [Jannaschia aquimarina]|uniref:DsbB protein n=1 Tax=Jannaschia aquimarina TaxID=935700 RepID=A0A0D1EJB3_9RHOB|nr:disulfide bond formation protein B [Jannaschia aquimarina]KIT15900.1 Disulfide bond formation protein B [Jannaschia aquimarina]SNS97360.1 Disulfide bond formation protein DsbB [Jannaschia aquimarina]
MRRLIALALLGHVGLLGGAFVFEAFGFAPCAMCIWQRWPHAAAILLGTLGLAGLAPRLMAAGGAVAAATTSGFGAYHAGVEQGWWEGPAACGSGGSLAGLSAGDLLSTEAPSDLVLCDEIVWQLGLTMAGWNFVLSAGLAVIWIVAATRRA